MNRPYFSPVAGAPPPLRVTVQRRVRFEEVDPLGIVWHGRYASYAEDARGALGERYGIGYMDFFRHGVLAPIRSMRVDFIRPLRLDDEFTVEGILHWADAARLDFEFAIRTADGETATTGCTVQVFTDTEGNLLFVPPGFIRDFRDRWREGRLP